MRITTQDDKSIYLLGAGAIIYFAGDTPPEGFLACTGANLSRVAYPKLFAEIGTKYGEGDGSTTFALPDGRDKFFEGANGNVGVSKVAGLPNVTGGFTSRTNYNQTPLESSGAFSSALDYSGANGVNITEYNSTYPPTQFIFSAARSNPIYGASATVQPPALTLLPCIKY